MKSWSRLLVASVILAAPSLAQDAESLRRQANAEANPERQVLLLCKAADLQPPRQDYRHDCDVSRAALISSDKQALKTALAASADNQPLKARRFAKYVSSLDPETHRQAAELLDRLNASETGAPPQPGAASTVTQAQNQPPSQIHLAPETTTTPNARPPRPVPDTMQIPQARPSLPNDLYANYLASGQRHQQAKDYAQAAAAYQAALAVNAHADTDDLTGKIRLMRDLAARQARQAADANPEDRKRRLLDEAGASMKKNDLDSAGRAFRQVLTLDPANGEARSGLAAITTVLNHDPALLEKTLRDAIVAFYSSRFEDAEARLNRYLGAEGGKKKGAAFFYLGATEATLALLDDTSARTSRNREARDDFKQARLAGYQPLERFVSARVLGYWKTAGM